MKARHANDGLRKRCGCPRSAWTKGGACAAHPWHFSFFRKRCACAPGAGCPHASTNQVRVSLNRHFGKPSGYEMSRSEALLLRDELRLQIQRGAFRDPDGQSAPPPADARLTLGDVADLYLARHVRKPGRREGPVAATANYLRIIRAAQIPAGGGRTARLEEKPIAEVTKPDVEAVRESRRRQLDGIVERRARAIGAGERPGRLALPGARGGEVGIEHMMATLRHLFAWAVREGHVEATPFMKHGLAVIDVRTSKRSPRRRRLDRESDEEGRLLAAAVPEGKLGTGGRAPAMASHLHDLIVAALESGCRKGELLSLQWWQVRTTNGAPDYIDLPADKTKTSEPRKVPITSRLRAILEYRRTGPDGRELPADAFVFGDEAGGRIKYVKTAWRAACRRAGIEGLNFHDLRHEFTSAMLDAGVPIHKVRDWVGHRNISTTSIYANTTLSHLSDARAAFERRTGAPLAQTPKDGGALQVVEEENRRV